MGHRLGLPKGGPGAAARKDLPLAGGFPWKESNMYAKTLVLATAILALGCSGTVGGGAPASTTAPGDAGAPTFQAPLDNQKTPVVLVEPRDATVPQGGWACFSVEAMGDPTPAIQWYRNGAVIAGATSSTVTISNTQLSDAGTYGVVLTNAAGGIAEGYRIGQLVALSDHINLMGDNPLIGPNDDEIGPRFPDMSEAYSKELIALAEQASLDLKIRVQKGVYVAMQGPSLETKAEYRFLRAIGADAVGMSTVPEDIVAVHMGMKVLGFSILTDECFPDALKPALLEEILKVATKAEPKMTAIMKEVVKRMNQ